MFLQGDYEENIHRTAIVYIENKCHANEKILLKNNNNKFKSNS